MSFLRLIFFGLLSFTCNLSFANPLESSTKQELDCEISSRSYEHDYLKTTNFLVFSLQNMQQNKLQIHCRNKNDELVIKIPIKFKHMFSLGPQVGFPALFLGMGMKDIYFVFKKLSSDKLDKIAGYYAGVRGGLGLAFVGCQGRAMSNKHGVIIYGLDYVYNFFSCRSDGEGAVLTASTFKIEFRPSTHEELTDPLVLDYTCSKSKPPRRQVWRAKRPVSQCHKYGS